MNDFKDAPLITDYYIEGETAKEFYARVDKQKKVEYKKLSGFELKFDATPTTVMFAK